MVHLTPAERDEIVAALIWVEQKRTATIDEAQIDAALAAWRRDWLSGPPEQNYRTAMRAALIAAGSPLNIVGDWPMTSTPELRTARRVIGDALGRQSADTVLDALAKAGLTITLAAQAGKEGRKMLSKDQIKHMVNRFLGWRLPEDFNPDGGISFKKTFNEHTTHPMKHEPVGTNLFDATQADAMVRYMAEGMAEESAPAPLGRADDGWVLVATAKPKPHAKYLVRRGEYVHTATPCYGMHAPWWVPTSINGPEYEPTTMLDTDEWRSLLAASPAPPVQSGEGKNDLIDCGFHRPAA